MTDTFKITKVTNRVWRGPRPTTRDDFEMLRKNGIYRIIDLESGWYDLLHPLNSRLDQKWMECIGINDLHFPMSAILPPNESQLSACIELIESNHQSTLIHCRRGVDRTGAVIAYYRRWVCGWHGSEAYREMLQSGFHVGRYFWWLPSIRKSLSMDIE